MKGSALSHNRRLKTILLFLLALLLIGISLFLLAKTLSKAYDTVPLTDEIEQRAGNATFWFDYRESYGKDIKPFALPERPDIVFCYSDHLALTLPAIYLQDKPDEAIISTPLNAYICDLNGDGVEELCVTCSVGFGMIDYRICIYDPVAKQTYELENRGYYDYSLEIRDGKLIAVKKSYPLSLYPPTDTVVCEGVPVLVPTANGVMVKIAVAE